ncbi:MAG: S41 family peptidase [Gammaproteobacteria bacterium]|nr:S41 family peptidase [Gammaproteobacteria bacterium]
MIKILSSLILLFSLFSPCPAINNTFIDSENNKHNLTETEQNILINALKDKYINKRGDAIKSKVSKVVLEKLIKNGEIKLFQISSQRPTINIEDIPPTVFYHITNKGVGYIRINSFALKTASSIHEVFDYFSTQTIKSMLIDLRGNYGGSFQYAASFADWFAAENLVICTINIANPEYNDQYRTTSERFKFAQSIPIIALTNSETSGSAEIVAAFLKNNKIATIVGEKTGGLGDTETIIPISTTLVAKFRTGIVLDSNGLVITGNGVMPDVIEKDINEKEVYKNDNLIDALNDAHHSTDKQYKKALEVFNKIIDSNSNRP